MRNLLQLVVAATMLTACQSEVVTFIAPLDGQSSVSPSAPLQIRTGGIGYPDGYPLPPDLVRVVQTESGERIAGTITTEPNGEAVDLLFWPDEEWERDQHFTWTITVPPQRAREPQIRIPDALTGEATFLTRFVVNLLEATLEDDGRVCLLLSQRVVLVPFVSVSLGGTKVHGTVRTVSLTQTVEGLSLAPGDAGGGALCIETDLVAPPGTPVEVQPIFGGPQAVPLFDGTLRDAIIARHHFEESTP